MTDNHTDEPADDPSDGETTSGVTAGDEAVDHLEMEVNLLNPATPFMRDHLKVVWATFLAWVTVVWGPILLTWLAPGAMTRTIPVIGFPLHYFLVALGAPTGALVLAAVYARQRDKLDTKYGIDPETAGETDSTGEERATAADRGVDE